MREGLGRGRSLVLYPAGCALFNNCPREFKRNPDTYEAGWAEGFARGPLFQEETPGDQRSIFVIGF